jgi:uracil-DNA glycosylase family 4
MTSAPTTGWSLVDTRITNAVRCVPPENKPTTEEIATCRGFLAATIAAMPKLEAVVTLGKIGHDSAVRALGEQAGDGCRSAMRPAMRWAG